MNQEPRYQNPYLLLTQEELDSITFDIQEQQRGLTAEYDLIQQARLIRYAENLRAKLDQRPETD